MSSTPKLTLICPACSCSFMLSEDSVLEDSLQLQISNLINRKSTGFSAKFHCSSCDYSFMSELKPEDIITGHSSGRQLSLDTIAQNKQQTIQEDLFYTTKNIQPDSTESHKIESEPDYFTEIAASSEHTQVVEQDILEEVRSATSSRLTFSEVSSDSQSWEKPELESNLEQEDLTDETFDSDNFQTTAEDHSTVSNQSAYSVNQELPHEDYSKYAVNSFANSQNNPKNDLWRDSKDIDGFQAASVSSRESAQTLHSSPVQSLFAQPTGMSDQFSGNDLMSSGFSDNNSSTRQPNFESYDEKEAVERSAGSTVTLLVLPILLLLAALSYLTFHLENNLKSADSAFDMLFPSSLREPPVGLFILEPSIRPLVLDSGDIVNVVQGKIVNKTNKTLDSIQLEGLGFSASGQLNNREKIMLGNPVSIRTVKLKTLTPSNIREIQSREVKKALKLRPSSDMDFVFVFTDPVSPRVLEMTEQKNTGRKDSLNSDMSSFALRIFAVR